jgi:thiol-disulfide isomerase/thioredoxin
MSKALFGLFLTLILLLAISPAQAASKAPLDFNLPTLDGKRLSLSQFRGRVVIVEFFATWCRPCKRALPKLNDFVKQFGDQGVSAIGYSIDKGGRRVVKPFVARLGLEFPVVLGTVKEAERLGQVQFLPTTLVLDPQGRVVKRFEGIVGRNHLMAAVRPYLKKASAPQPSVAKVKVRKPGQSRFTDLWVTDNERVGNQTGIFVHVVADVADQRTVRGLWLVLNLQPEAGGKVSKLFQRIEDVTKEYYVMFVRCGQLPNLEGSRAFKAWVSILDHQRNTLEDSSRFLMAGSCAPGAGDLAAVQPPKKFNTPQTPPAGQQYEPLPFKSLKLEQGRIKELRVSQDQVHEGKPGLMMHIKADLGDIPTEDGLWLALNLWSEDQGGRGLSPNGEAYQFIRKVDSTFLDEYILFIRCDQFPRLPPGGAFRVWLTVLVGPKKNVVARSGEFMLGRPCTLAARSR